MSQLLAGRYEVLELLGQGGHGRVVRAIDTRHHRPVALKIRNLTAPGDREQALDEARVLLSIRPHASIALARDDFFTTAEHVLVMDWVDGRSLEDLLDDGAMPIEVLVPRLRDVADALDYIHRHDPPVVHGDVKPANILIDREGRAVLVDFGSSTTGAVRTGTRGFVAPEVAGGAHPTARSDIYGLAATAFALLTATPPAAGQSMQGVPIHAQRALQAGLSVDPRNRPASASEFVDGLGAPTAQTNLPRRLSSFVGRSRELSEIGAMLHRTKLLTLVGPPGVGKTALATEAARARLGSGLDGVWFVDLGSVEGANDVVRAFAQAVGGPPAVPPEDGTVAALSAGSHLIVVDNCEHVMDEVTRIIELVLKSCPDVTFAATSRERLRAEGESVYSTPVWSEDDAVRFLFDRAAAFSPPVAIDVEAAEAISGRLDHLPLALELAAARLDELEPSELICAFDEQREYLAAGSRTRTRHDGIEAAVGWSYRLLEQREKAVLRRLSVFRGDFRPDAAAAVATGKRVVEGEVSRLLDRLVDRSLILSDEMTGRLRLLEPVRQFAERRLRRAGEVDEAASRHFDWLLEMVKSSSDPIDPNFEAIESDHDNLRVALDRAVITNADRALAMATRLSHFWRFRGFGLEGRQRLESALSAVIPATSNESDRAFALLYLGKFALLQTDFAAARRWLEDASLLFAKLKNVVSVGDAKLCLGTAALAQGDPAEANRYLDEALSSFREAGNRRAEALTLVARADVKVALADLVGAWRDLEESKPVLHEVGDEYSIAAATNNLGMVALRMADYETARGYAEEALQMNEKLGVATGVCVALSNLAVITAFEGNYVEAVGYSREGAELAEQLGDRQLLQNLLASEGLALLRLDRIDEARAAHARALPLAVELDTDINKAACVGGFGVIAYRTGSYFDGARLMLSARAIGERDRVAFASAPICSLLDETLTAARAELGQAEYSRAAAAGSSTSLAEILSELMLAHDTRETGV